MGFCGIISLFCFSCLVVQKLILNMCLKFAEKQSFHHIWPFRCAQYVWNYFPRKNIQREVLAAEIVTYSRVLSNTQQLCEVSANTATNASELNHTWSDKYIARIFHRSNTSSWLNHCYNYHMTRFSLETWAEYLKRKLSLNLFPRNVCETIWPTLYVAYIVQYWAWCVHVLLFWIICRAMTPWTILYEAVPLSKFYLDLSFEGEWILDCSHVFSTLLRTYTFVSSLSSYADIRICIKSLSIGYLR